MNPDYPLITVNPDNIRRRPHLHRWLRVLLTGGLLWAAAVAALALSADTYIVPTVVILGSFVVPIAWVTRIRERDHPTEATPQLLAKAFVCGGLAGFLSSAVIETSFSSAGLAVFTLGVGLVEETMKGLALLWVVRNLALGSPAFGFDLGAAVGFGFAAFEDSGYALSSLMQSHSWSGLVATELVRAVTAPVTHGLWTAMIGAVVFGYSRNGRRLSVPLLYTFATVVGLHTLWDLAPNIALGVDLHSLGGGASSGLLPQAIPASVAGLRRMVDQATQYLALAIPGGLGLLGAHLIRQRLLINRPAFLWAGREEVPDRATRATETRMVEPAGPARSLHVDEHRLERLLRAGMNAAHRPCRRQSIQHRRC